MDAERLLPLFPDVPASLTPLSEPETEAVILDEIRAGAGAGLARQADLFLATLCARTSADRIVSAGLWVVRAP